MRIRDISLILISKHSLVGRYQQRKMHVYFTSVIFAANIEDLSSQEGTETFTLAKFSACVFLCVHMHQENNT